MREPLAWLEQLYRDVGPALLGYLVRICPDRHTAEDALQDTFVQAARNLSRLTAAESPRAWLYGIARHVAGTLRRRRGLQPLPADWPAPDRAGLRTDVEAVHAAVAELSPGLREALELRLREGLSYEEIAAVLNVPLGTVRSRLHSALRRVRETLEPTDTPVRGAI